MERESSYSTKTPLSQFKKDNKEPLGIHFQKPSTRILSTFIDYIPHVLTNIINSHEVIESCYGEKIIHLFQKHLLEGNYRRTILKIDGTSEEEKLESYEKAGSSRFNFSSNLNPYEYITSVLEDSDYYGEFYLTNRNKMLFIPSIRSRKNNFIDPVLGPNKPENARDIFAHSLDGFHFILFLNKFQLFFEKESHGQIISLDHLKSIALFTCLLDIPKTFISFLFEETTDDFLRSLAVYFQYFLQLWDVLTIRSEMKKSKLPNPCSSSIEKEWERNLNDLRFFVARNYIIMILGTEKNMQNYHHLNRKFSICGNDIVNYELLYHFSAQIMMMIFNHENDLRCRQIILDQVDKLFRIPLAGSEDPYDTLSPSDRAILEGKFHKPFSWDVACPCLLEIKRPGRDLKLLNTGKSIIITKNKRLRLLQSALLVPDEKIEQANIKLGILGKPRADYPPLLNCSQISFTERNEGLQIINKNDSGYINKEYSWRKPTLVRKELPDKAYNIDYSLLIKKHISKKPFIKLWKKYSRASDRFWYKIDCHFTVVDCFKQKFLQIFEEQAFNRSQFERRIKSLVQKIKRD